MCAMVAPMISESVLGATLLLLNHSICLWPGLAPVPAPAPPPAGGGEDFVGEIQFQVCYSFPIYHMNPSSSPDEDTRGALLKGDRIFSFLAHRPLCWPTALRERYAWLALDGCTCCACTLPSLGASAPYSFCYPRPHILMRARRMVFTVAGL